MATEDEVKAIWRSADCVCLDVDSTVCMDEGIDELAKYMDVGDKVKSLTTSAMTGEMTYKESLRQRLQLMEPSRQDITRFITDHTPKLTDGVKDLVKLLHKRGVPVYLISGGFQSIIETVAEELNIPKKNIRANRILFYYNGQYGGFDEELPTCDCDGKPRVIGKMKEDFGYKRLVHIGDGATDMIACPPGDAFIGFGGNQVRQKVKDESKWFVYSFQTLIDELNRKAPKLANDS